MLRWIIDAILNWLGSAGRLEQQNADMKADMAVIAKANEAAKKVEQEEGGYADPNDRDAR